MPKLATELFQSGLAYVIAGYGVLILFVVVTFSLGPFGILEYFNSQPWGILAAITIFDSWYTILGLIGAVVIFAFVLFEMRAPDRVVLSVFFLVVSMASAPLSAMLWNRYYNDSGLIPGGSSTVAVAAEAIVFTLSIFAMFGLLRQQSWRLGSWSKYWVFTSVILYMAIILGTLFYAIEFQPLFVPTNQYNWRAHQFAFFIAMGATVIYGAATFPSFGLDGKLLIDEKLMNAHFVDLRREKFDHSLPIYRLVFKPLGANSKMECHPELKEIWVSMSYKDKDYKLMGKEFDRALLHEMVHAELFKRGAHWSHRDPAAREAFDQLAKAVGTSLEAET